MYDSPDLKAVFGYSKDEIEEVYAAFPNWNLYDEGATGEDASGNVLRNAFAWLLNGPEDQKKVMYAQLSFEHGLLPELYEKLQS